MELQSHFIDSVNVWLVAGGEVIKEYPITGYWRLPDATHNPTQHRYFLFELPLEKEQNYQVFIRGYVIPNFPQRYAIEYWEPARFRNYQRRGDWGWAMFTGITVMVTFLALLCFIFHPRRIYLYYGGYVFCLVLYALTNDGWGIFFPKPIQQELNPITIGYFLSLSFCFFLLFSRQFLTIPRDASQGWLRLNPWFIWILMAICIVIAQYGFSQQNETIIKVSYRIGLLLALAVALLWVGYVYHALQKGFKPAWLLLASQVVMIGFYGTNVFLMNSGLVLHAFPDIIVLRIALVSELLIIAIGWVYRQKVIRESQEKLEVANAAQKLEIKEAENHWKDEEIKALKLQNELYSQRERLARELHDGIGSQLAHITSRLDVLTFAPTPLQNQLHRLSELSRETTQNLREILWIFHQESIRLHDFADRLHGLLLRLWEDLENPTLLWQAPCKGNNPVLPPLVVLHLLRITQEAIVNALKYAEASEVSVCLEASFSDVVLTVTDNGRGFNASAAASGHGLTNMRRRAEEVSGCFQLNTGPSGTSIKVTIPL